MEITDDKHPQFQVIFGKKYEHRTRENIDAEEFIAKKGYTAKGKKCHQYDVKKVKFIEPLEKPDDEAVVEDAGQPSEPEEPEEPMDIMPDEPAGGLPDIDNLPEEGDIFEPTLF